MTTLAPEAGTSPVPAARRRGTPAPIPLPRIVSVELRKMFDTRSGFWMMASIGISALLATAAVIVWAPDKELTYSTFATAIGFPMSVILPMVAILSVTSEWSQRSGLTTFTLVPHRGRVIGAKAIGTVLIGVVSMLLAMGIGAVGNVVGTAITGTDLVWNASLTDLSQIVLGNVLGMLVGFTLGVLIRNSAGAIVGYFVYGFVEPTISTILAASWHRWDDLRVWADFQYASTNLFGGQMSSADWGNLGIATVLWLGIPLAIGLRLLMRSEVK